MNQNKIWHFRSESTHSRIYTLQEIDGKLVCNCPSFVYRKDRDCRHIKLVKNDVLGPSISEEPDLIPARTDRVMKQGNKILVPLARGLIELYQVAYELRKLGISKRRLNEYFNTELGSDDQIEGVLKDMGYSEEGIKRKIPIFALVRWSR